MKNCMIGTTIVCLTVISSIVCINIPTPPEILEVKCYRRSAILSWSPTGLEPINEYKIQYKTNWSPNEWIDYGYKVPLSGDHKSVRLILSPWANYTFRISAVNNAGASNYSGISDTCVTEEDVPHKNPEDVFGRGNGPHNLAITWKPMPPIEQNAPGFFYTVYWRLNDEVNAEWHHRTIHEWQQHKLLIENLPKLRPYRIKVEAHNSLGKSAVEAEEVIGVSDEDKPSEEPKMLKAIEIIDGDSAKLQWEAVPPKSINGHFKGYKVEVWTDSDLNKTVKIVSANTTTAVIDIFTPAKTNKVVVRAFNGAFDGPESNTVTLDMPEDVYPDPPSFTWTRTRDQNNKAVIRITLEPNMTNKNPGEKIYIQYRKKGIAVTDKWDNTYKETIDGSEHTSELVNLDFEVFYEVRVAAQSGNLSSFSNISTIDTHSHKWPKPTTTTTPIPPTTPSTRPPIIYTNSDGLNPHRESDTDSSQEDNGSDNRIAEGDNENGGGFSKTPWLIALIVLVVFIFIFVGVFIYLKQRKTGAHTVNRNRKPPPEQNNEVTTNANGNGPIRPNEMDNFIVIDNNNPNGSVGHDEGDDEEPNRRQRDVYQGTTESHH